MPLFMPPTLVARWRLIWKKTNKYYIANIRIGKKSRDITLYKIEDKNKQRQLYQKYEPLFLTQIDDAVYSYRKGRSNWTAIQKITPLLSQYKYYLVCDIKDFFPSINRKILTQQLNKFIPNNDVKIIMNMLLAVKLEYQKEFERIWG